MILKSPPSIPFDERKWDSILSIGVDTCHHYLADKFDRYMYWRFLTDDPTRLKYSHPQNYVGYQQRCWQVFWSIYACHQGGIGLDLGSAGLRHSWLLSTDCPSKIYQEKYDKGGGIKYDLRVNAEDVSMFGDNVFSLVIANHVVEHFPTEKMVEIIRGWLRVTRPGGFVAVITPHNDFVPVLQIDKDHKSAWTPKTWHEMVTMGVQDLIETVVEYDDFDNGFSFPWVVRRK